MRHQPNDEQLDRFFHRLNQPLQRMPQPARAELHRELRQHLDALIAAHEELGASPQEAFDRALRQFGDPGKVGRKLWWEWLLTSLQPSEEFQAVLYALGSCLLLGPLLFLLGFLALPVGIASLTSPAAADDFLNSHSYALSLGVLAGMPLLSGLLTGRKYPRRPARAMFWASVSLLAFLLPVLGTASLILHQDFPPDFLPAFGLMTLAGCLSASAACRASRPAAPSPS